MRCCPARRAILTRKLSASAAAPLHRICKRIVGDARLHIDGSPSPSAPQHSASSECNGAPREVRRLVLRSDVSAARTAPSH
jgi:hypothetical protein